MLVLIGVLLVIVGFAIRLNPLIVVTVAGIVTALLGGMNPAQILDAFGTGFASSRSVTIFVAVLPVVGIIEFFGLQEQAKTAHRRARQADRRARPARLPGWFARSPPPWA